MCQTEHPSEWRSPRIGNIQTPIKERLNVFDSWINSNLILLINQVSSYYWRISVWTIKCVKRTIHLNEGVRGLGISRHRSRNDWMYSIPESYPLNQSGNHFWTSPSPSLLVTLSCKSQHRAWQKIGRAPWLLPITKPSHFFHLFSSQ